MDVTNLKQCTGEEDAGEEEEVVKDAGDEDEEEEEEDEEDEEDEDEDEDEEDEDEDEDEDEEDVDEDEDVDDDEDVYTMLDFMNVLELIDTLAELPDIEQNETSPMYTFSKENETKGMDLVDRAKEMASQLLIDSYGGCNWDNINILEKNKYYVNPIEQDSFGWLIAGIQTDKGELIYG